MPAKITTKFIELKFTRHVTGDRIKTKGWVIIVEDFIRQMKLKM